MPKRGYKASKKHKSNLSKAHKGQVAWNKGEINCYSKKTIKMMSEASRKRIGEKSSIGIKNV